MTAPGRPPLTDDVQHNDGGPDDVQQDDDLIASDEPSRLSAGFQHAIDRFIPAQVGRGLLGAVTVAALVLGGFGGYLIGKPGNRASDPGQSQADGSVQDERIPLPLGESDAVLVGSSADAYLTVADLTSSGETTLAVTLGLGNVAEPDRVCGVRFGPEIPIQAPPRVPAAVVNAVSFALADATVTERISADLDVLAASTLRARVQLAGNCPNNQGFYTSTDGVRSGIGDEYAIIEAVILGVAPEQYSALVVILVRIGGRLIEISMAAQDSPDVPDIVRRLMRIAGAAVTRMGG